MLIKEVNLKLLIITIVSTGKGSHIMQGHKL